MFRCCSGQAIRIDSEKLTALMSINYQRNGFYLIITYTNTKTEPHDDEVEMSWLYKEKSLRKLIDLSLEPNEFGFFNLFK